jgi:dihydrofolate reductase
MGTLTLDFFSSVDGYATAEGWPGYWGFEGPELIAWIEEKLGPDQAFVMGADTYRLMSGIVTEGDDPTFPRMTAIPKFVFSSTLEPPLTWDNTTLVSGDAVAEVRRLKEESDRPIVTIGSLSLSRSLLKAGVVDLFRVTIFPVITGVTGREPIYDGWPDATLQLVSSRTLDGRIQVLEYVPTVI